MKGKINKQGHLAIEKKGVLILQGCPFSDSECGHWCPLFGEPTISKWMGSPDPDEKDRELNSKHWDLKICRTTLCFEDFTDER